MYNMKYGLKKEQKLFVVKRSENIKGYLTWPMTKHVSSNVLVVLEAFPGHFFLVWVLGWTIRNIYILTSGRVGASYIQLSITSFFRGEIEFPTGFDFVFHKFGGCDNALSLFGEGKLNYPGIFKTITMMTRSCFAAITESGDKYHVVLYV